MLKKKERKRKSVIYVHSQRESVEYRYIDTAMTIFSEDNTNKKKEEEITTN